MDLPTTLALRAVLRGLAREGAIGQTQVRSIVRELNEVGRELHDDWRRYNDEESVLALAREIAKDAGVTDEVGALPLTPAVL